MASVGGNFGIKIGMNINLDFREFCLNEAELIDSCFQFGSFRYLAECFGKSFD